MRDDYFEELMDPEGHARQGSNALVMTVACLALAALAYFLG